jgi:hypothetical protein
MAAVVEADMTRVRAILRCPATILDEKGERRQPRTKGLRVTVNALLEEQLFKVSRALARSFALSNRILPY